MEQNNIRRKQIIFLQWLAFAACVAVILCVLYFTLRDFFVLKNSGYIRPASHHHMALMPAAAYKINPTEIRGWMTFSYLNQQFNLPVNYLQTSLKITDKKYPNLAVYTLASEQKKDPIQVLLTVEQVVENYLNKPKPAN